MDSASPLTLPLAAGPGRPSPGAARPRLARALAALAVGGTVGYLTWRVAATLVLATWWVTVPLIALEVYALATFVLFAFTAWDTGAVTPAEPTTRAPGRVAVLIPTYNEPVEILLPTVAAALAMSVEHETYVLDDGDRGWVRAVASELGAAYRTRTDRAHAKAGNINAALREIDADFVAILDADHVPTPQFLAHTLGYFDDPRVALVQTPQDFYNLDSFEHLPASRLAQLWGRLVGRGRGASRVFCEQALFYRVLQPGRNRWNAAFWCGTNAVLRTSALAEVGGLATESVTEDIHTTIRLHRRGWRTVYHDEVLARGLAAADAGQYLSQRVRWGTGAMQVLRQENPLAGRGLTVPQRLSYAATLLGWFDAWRTLGYLLLPVLVLLTGASPISAPASTFAAVFVPTLLVQQAALAALGRGHGSLPRALLFEFIRLPASLLATLTVLTARETPFRVTAKGRQGDVRQRVRVPALHLALVALCVTALVVFALSRYGIGPLHYGSPWAASAAAGWLLLDLAVLVLAMDRITSPTYASERRAAVRFPVRATTVVQAAVRVDGAPARLVDISLTGARVELGAGRPTPTAARLELRLGGQPLVVDTLVCGPTGPGSGPCALEFLPGQLHAQAVLALALFHPTALPARPAVPTPAHRVPAAAGGWSLGRSAALPQNA